ncbi:MAG: SGNH/GDSL hydrolase family protein [Crocosphaera sp.]
MKRLFLLASIVSLSSVISSSAIAANFSAIYGFGDSLSDTGNLNQVFFEAIGGTQTFPPSPPYFMGRFSNGLSWIELLSQRLDIPLVNFAFGGATTGFDNTLDTRLPGLPLVGLQQQINNFTVKNPGADPNALYTIWAGANDYLPTNSIVFTPFDNSDQTLSNIEMAINSLVGIGAKHIMVFNLPNLGDIPENNQSVDGICPDDNQFDGDCLNDLTLAHNNGLSSLLSSFSSETNLIPIDINTLVDDTIQNPFPIFTNVTDACLNLNTFEVCENPNEFLFWDNRHPTELGNQLISELAFESLGIPEPKTIVGLLTIGLIAIGTKIKKIANN